MIPASRRMALAGLKAMLSWAWMMMVPPSQVFLGIMSGHSELLRFEPAHLRKKVVKSAGFHDFSFLCRKIVVVRFKVSGSCCLLPSMNQIFDNLPRDYQPRHRRDKDVAARNVPGCFSDPDRRRSMVSRSLEIMAPPWASPCPLMNLVRASTTKSAPSCRGFWL